MHNLQDKLTFLSNCQFPERIKDTVKLIKYCNMTRFVQCFIPFSSLLVSQQPMLKERMVSCSTYFNLWCSARAVEKTVDGNKHILSNLL